MVSLRDRRHGRDHREPLFSLLYRLMRCLLGPRRCWFAAVLVAALSRLVHRRLVHGLDKSRYFRDPSLMSH
ncbi:hypothetical protein [Spirillospora sp. NPDC029432]|uniref:hypothetical protein n=1 Tax=Spirillospora sp. NPDC029432 TaxID=3154599 RepID=UPI00345490A9